MTTGQFNFSFSVGVALVALGGVMLGKSTVGLSLIALGAAIATLALLTRGAQRKQTESIPAPASQTRDRATGY